MHHSSFTTLFQIWICIWRCCLRMRTGKWSCHCHWFQHGCQASISSHLLQKDRSCRNGIAGQSYCNIKIKESWWVTLCPGEDGNSKQYLPSTKHPQFFGCWTLYSTQMIRLTCKTRDWCGSCVCRHILSFVLDLTPKMVALQWHKSYAFLFGALEHQDEVTHRMREYIDHIECHCGPVMLEEGEDASEYHISTIMKLDGIL